MWNGSAWAPANLASTAPFSQVYEPGGNITLTNGAITGIGIAISTPGLYLITGFCSITATANAGGPLDVWFGTGYATTAGALVGMTLYVPAGGGARGTLTAVYNTATAGANIYMNFYHGLGGTVYALQNSAIQGVGFATGLLFVKIG